MGREVRAKDVWEAIVRDPEFRGQPEPVQEAMRPYIEALPEVLSDELSLPVTLANLMQVKLKYMHYLLDNGFIAAVVAATPDEALGWFDREDLAPMMEGLLSQALEMAESIVVDVDAVLAQFGADEHEIMKGPKVNLQHEVWQLYEKGRLTIAELLRRQPMVIVKNS